LFGLAIFGWFRFFLLAKTKDLKKKHTSNLKNVRNPSFHDSKRKNKSELRTIFGPSSDLSGQEPEEGQRAGWCSLSFSKRRQVGLPHFFWRCALMFGHAFFG